jgi:hypothetical protein
MNEEVEWKHCFLCRGQGKYAKNDKYPVCFQCLTSETVRETVGVRESTPKRVRKWMYLIREHIALMIGEMLAHPDLPGRHRHKIVVGLKECINIFKKELDNIHPMQYVEILDDFLGMFTGLIQVE